MKTGEPKRLGLRGPTGPKSTEKDEVDEIYNNEDPIGATTDKRKEKGSIMEHVTGTQSRQGKFFFSLKLKGGQPELK